MLFRQQGDEIELGEMLGEQNYVASFFKQKY